MRHASVLLAIAAALLAFAHPADAAVDPPQPEIQRPVAAPQPVGQLHTMRTIPEACVRLQGEFTGAAATPYRFEAVKRAPCAQRAGYVDAATLKHPPSAASGWILNDRISVPRTDAPACVATIEVWRRQGNATPPKLDAQGRSRLYLDEPEKTDAIPVFTATLMALKDCG